MIYTNIVARMWWTLLRWLVPIGLQHGPWVARPRSVQCFAPNNVQSGIQPAARAHTATCPYMHGSNPDTSSLQYCVKAKDCPPMLRLDRFCEASPVCGLCRFYTDDPVLACLFVLKD